MFEAIRRDRREDPDVSIRELAVRHGVHRRTVRQALAAAEPPPRKVPVRTVPGLDPVRPLIDAMLRQDLDAPREQRHTALRVRERLLAEHRLVVAYSTVRDYVREARPRIATESRGQLKPPWWGWRTPMPGSVPSRTASVLSRKFLPGLGILDEALALSCRVSDDGRRDGWSDYPAEGGTNMVVAGRLGISRATVRKWRVRFVADRLDGLGDSPGLGRPQDHRCRCGEVIVKTLEESPRDATHWSTRSMAASVAMSQTAVSRIWRAFGLKPHLVEGFKLSPDPLFIDKVRDIVGLYLNSPDAALVLCEPAWVLRRALLGRGGFAVAGGLIVVVLFVLDRGDVADRGVESLVVVPVDPAGGGLFDLAPRVPDLAFVEDDLGLEQPDRGFHQRVVQGVADGADRAGDPGLHQGLGERQRRVLGGFNRSSQHRLVGARVGGR